MSMTTLNSDEMDLLFGNAKEVEVSNANKEQKQEENKQVANEPTGSESRGNEVKDDTKTGDDTVNAKSTVSPENNTFTSIAKALAEDGIFPDLDFNSVKTAADLKKVFEEQIDNRLDERQKRVINALNYGMDESDIQKFEANLKWCENLEGNLSIVLDGTNKNSEKVRKDIIVRDYLAKGFDKDRAIRMADQAIQNGTDIQEAKDALTSLKVFYKALYDRTAAAAEADMKEAQKERDEMLNKFKESVKTKEKAFGTIVLDDRTKEGIIDTVLNPKHKTADGRYLTDLQSYTENNREDYLRYVGTFFYLTKGFTDFSGLFSQATQKALKKGFAQLEDMLKNPTDQSNGSMSMVGGSSASVNDLFTGNYTVG